MRSLAVVLSACIAGCGGSSTVSTSSTPPNGGDSNGGVGTPTPGGGGTPAPGGGGGGGGGGGAGGVGGGSGGGGSGGSGGGDMGSPGPLTWTAESSGTTQNLLGVWGNGPDNVFAVGTGGTIVRSKGDGQWTTIASATTNDLTSVWVPSSIEVYILSRSSTGPVMLHSSDDGSTFTSATVGPLPNHRSDQEQVWGVSPDDVYAVMGDVYRSTDHGATWSPVLVAPPVMKDVDSMSLAGIWGSSATDFYLVGVLTSAQQGPSDQSQLIRHTTNGGQTWTDFSEGTTVPLYAVWGSGANDVWAVGGNTRVRHSTDGGASYPDVEPAWLQGAAASVWGTSANDVFVFSEGKGLIHSTTNGSAWELVDLPVTCSGDACGAYHGWSANAQDVYLVGTGGRILHGH